VCDIWPLEKEFDRDSYIGVPMFDSTGKIIGHFACMDGSPMRQDLPHLALFKIFSVRAAAELERMLLRQKLGATSSQPTKT
jgi:GAF domain-containing protein